ncbi:hypothetical protein PCANC_16095 [Puccinia coronata f. sp. avenae]|uniref:Uncharacterized protein n=1 Tax=Puccinia coronata f. sp. avenae TaxID=200324 RepID=A0A2N5RUA1_9BASI|nr:hypothetical protein PCASD_26218 [Puccinia coronata f. sp. avenae]PLW11859.1 hypothetical protein PCANC_22244 [Puccinia coronata f. sp. avenae]PLW36029.1 hypothetical protein PCANC_16095 [Puccinia coronata f. sp. avenae]
MTKKIQLALLPIALFLLISSVFASAIPTRSLSKRWPSSSTVRLAIGRGGSQLVSAVRHEASSGAAGASDAVQKSGASSWWMENSVTNQAETAPRSLPLVKEQSKK